MELWSNKPWEQARTHTHGRCEGAVTLNTWETGHDTHTHGWFGGAVALNTLETGHDTHTGGLRELWPKTPWKQARTHTRVV